MTVPLDYETLRVIWWALLGVLLIGFAVMDGHDLGVGMLLPFIGQSDEERRLVINSVAPTWEGHQVWLVLGAGAIFAAWPMIYAIAFSGFYLAMFLVLASLILRPVGFKYRGKIDDQRWRTWWDWCLFTAGAVPAVVFGVAVGNALVGVPFTLDADLRMAYQGNGLTELLTPFPLLCGLVSGAMLVMHGAVFLANKTEGDINKRARSWAGVAAAVTVVLFAAGGLWAAGINGYVAGSLVHDGPSNPLLKDVTRLPGALMDNYGRYPLAMLAPGAGIAGAILAAVLLRLGREKLAMLASSLSVIGIVTTAGVSNYPFILPSSINPKASLTVFDSSSSQLTLFVMLLATVFFMPLIMAYTTWVIRVMRGKVTKAWLKEQNNAY